MSEGTIGTLTVHSWSGNPELLKVIVRDITPDNLVGSVYAWENYRSPVCEITTVTLDSDAGAKTTWSNIFPKIGTTQNCTLEASCGTLTFVAKIIDAVPEYPKQIVSSEGSYTQMIVCHWRMEVTV
jgi:hypothetical protein